MKKLNIVYLVLLISCIAIFTVYQTAYVRQTSSDSQLTLLTAQSIIENGSVDLSDYYKKVPEDEFASGTWKYRINKVKNQIEYIYPIGNSILSIPFVFVANKLGMNMLIHEQDAKLQIFIASLLGIVLFLLNFRLARLFLEDYRAVLVSLIFTFSTSYISTCATALWSFNAELILIVLVLTEMAKSELDSSHKLNFALLSFYLLFAWVCRPSSMIFVAIFFIWLLFKNKTILFKTLLSFIVLFGFFLLFSYRQYGSFIPFYYNPLMWQSMDKNVSIWEGFCLVLFSPSRGLFIYSPFLLLSFFSCFTAARKTLLFKVLIVWFIIYAFSLGNLSNWWGGWSFGARLCTDLIPCLFLLFLLGFKHIDNRKIIHKTIIFAFLFASILGFQINTVQGLYNPEVVNWNNNPSIDHQQEFYKWNWKYPQFLANRLNNEIKRIDFELNNLYSTFIIRTPEKAKILMEAPNENYKNIIDEWNKRETYGKRHFFYSLNNVVKGDTFYFFKSSYDYVKSSNNINVLFQLDVKISEFLNQNRNQFIILTSKGNWKGHISEKLKNTCKAFGLKLANLNNVKSYLAVIDKAQVTHEYSHESDEVKVDLFFNGNKLEISSAPDTASTKLNGKEFNANSNGLNILVLNHNLDVLHVGYVNLKSNENYIDLFLYKGLK